MKPENAYTSYHKTDYEMPVEEALELARGHHVTGNYILAERTYHDILRAMPDNPTTNHLLGALYYQIGSTDQAIHYMKISTDLEPSEMQYWSNYGSVLNLAGRYEEAIECFDKVLENTPDNIETLNRKALTLWQMERLEDAEAVARLSLEKGPNNLDGYVNLGLSLAKQKRFHDAVAIWKEASKHHENDVRIYSNWSNMVREMKMLKKAQIIARKAVDLDAKNVDAQNNLGCILKEIGRHEEAIECFKNATNISPKYYQAHHNMAMCYAEMGRHEETTIAARYAIDFNPAYAPAYTTLATSLVELGEFQQAHFAAQRAVQLRPDAESYLSLCQVLYLSSRFDDGYAALQEALKIEPDNAAAYFKLADIYERLDESREAVIAIDKAIELEPEIPIFKARKAALLHVANDVEGCVKLISEVIDAAPNMILPYVTKAEALIALNRQDEARKVIETAKSINENSPIIYFTLMNLKKLETEDDPDFQKMLGLQDKAGRMGLNYEASLYFAIANSYEKLKKYDLAFEYIEKACACRRKTLPYDNQMGEYVFANIKREFPAEAFTAYEGKGHDSDIPVFIVGMPRSGTTLTEQIISSHPEVFGAGELPDISRARRKFYTINPENVAELGKLYVEYATARDKTGNAKRITDKMPGNFMNIGLIACALPNAKIIHCRRNPFDTCLSNYKQNFLAGQHWSYDLEEMGHEYKRYLDLMNYWREVLPGRFLDIDYEDTVSNLEDQARKMIDFIGLEWDEACLEPHKQERAILTASKMQVTKPVYTSSVEKWRRYEKQLQPLVRIIQPELALPEEAAE
jgi:tetratricopeptide (TPR) repeat protein